MDTRYGRVKWGKGSPRLRHSEATFNAPLAWNKKPWVCDECGGFFSEKKDHQRDFRGNPIAFHRRRVFSLSLGDWLDDEVPIEWLADMQDVIHRCPNMDFLLLTKRPENWKKRMEEVRLYCVSRPNVYIFNKIDEWLKGIPPLNIWIGTSVENQKAADERIPELLKIPAKVRFLSCEPLLGDVFLKLTKEIHWVIAGGESGYGSRPMHPYWIRSLRNQCKAMGVPFLFKQHGEFTSQTIPGVEVKVNSLKSNQQVGMGDGKTNHILYTRVGKKAAGRLLDGKEWNEFPESTV